MPLEKVLVISPSPFPGIRGDSTNYIEMINGFMQLGIEVSLLCPKNLNGHSFDEEMRRRGVSVIRMPVSPPRLEEVGQRQIVFSTVLKQAMFYVVEFLMSLAVLIERNTKLVMIRHCIHTINLPPLLGVLARILRIQSVADGDLVSASGSQGIIQIPRFLLRILALYEQAAIGLYAHFVVSTPAQVGLLRRVGLPESRIILKGLGIDIKKVPVHDPIDIPRNTFAYFGGLERWQNIDHLLKAWAKAMGWRKGKKTGAMLFVIGDGSMKDDLRKLASELQITESTTFLDGISRETLWAEYFKLFRALIIPRSSRFFPEEFPMKLIEALAAGKPVIATRVPGITTMIKESDGVVFAKPDDEESLALSICRLMNNDREIFALSKRAIRASRRFDLDSQLRRIAQILAD